jgi:hypothetical protein
VTQPAAAQAPLTTEELDALTRSLGLYATQLADLMNAETTLLRTKRIAGPPALQQEKQRLSAAYAATCGAVKANHAGFAALPAALKESVRLQLQRLTAASEANVGALRVVQTATERVMNIVVRAVREQRATIVGYTRSCAPPRRIPGGLGLALDRHF